MQFDLASQASHTTPVFLQCLGSEILAIGSPVQLKVVGAQVCVEWWCLVQLSIAWSLYNSSTTTVIITFMTT